MDGQDGRGIDVNGTFTNFTLRHHFCYNVTKIKQMMWKGDEAHTAGFEISTALSPKMPHSPGYEAVRTSVTPVNFKPDYTAQKSRRYPPKKCIHNFD